MNKNFYITTTLPYVNAKPHIGFALEIVQADVIARYNRLIGNDVVFNTGTDEHGQKIYEKALEEKKDVQTYVDEYAAKFEALKLALNLSYTNFVRTTDEHHVKAAQEFWKICRDSGDIYKKQYQTKYCVGCELEKTDSELEDGRCPVHKNLELEQRDEENYFFKFSKYQQALLELYSSRKDFVLPHHRQKEIKNFVESGLKDFSISRLKTKMPWGVPVPDDEDHVMYVWFDALVNYISTLGWPDKKSDFGKFWPGMQVAGKDNLRQQAGMWQAMLMSAGIEPSKQIFIHGFITAGGQKMSKSLGNVIDPLEIVAKYGTDALRYYLLREIPSGEDGDFSEERFLERYNGDLANGLGNLLQRVVTMAEKYTNSLVPKKVKQEEFDIGGAWKKYEESLSEFDFGGALDSVWSLVRGANQYIDDKKPWAMAKNGETSELEAVLYILLEVIRHAAILLNPFIPETSAKILTSLGYGEADIIDTKLDGAREWGVLPEGQELKKQESLFPHIDL